MTLYALRSPKGKLIESTVTANVEARWSSEAYEWCCIYARSKALREAMRWKDWEGSRDRAAALGWKVVRVKLVEAKK